MKKWSGRFEEATHPKMMAFQSSIKVDKQMVVEDLMGSMAHVKMLKACKILNDKVADQLQYVLTQLYGEAIQGKLHLDDSCEDVHMAIEGILTEQLGEAGKTLHTARSRNDQVAVDLKLYMKKNLVGVLEQLSEMQGVLLDLSKQHAEALMPAYTHSQRAQPITLGYHLLTYVQMFDRDFNRLNDCLKRLDSLPLGSGAVSGVSYATNRALLAQLLGFEKVAEHAMDAISDRDHVIECLSDLSLVMMHLSRMAEEIILWSSQEFGFIRVSDGFATGSSMMPQKRNPDAAELIRGKTGRVYGSLTSVLTVMKGLPLAYNKDMQEDKEGLFDALETVKMSLEIMSAMLASAQFVTPKMQLATLQGFLNATEAADYLVGKGVPFREAHEVIAKLVTWCEQGGKVIEDVDLETLKIFHQAFESNFSASMSMKACLEKKVSSGSTGPDQVQSLIVMGDEMYKQNSYLVQQLHEKNANVIKDLFNFK